MTLEYPDHIRVYYIIPSDKNGDYNWDTVTQKRAAIALGRRLFREMADEADAEFAVYVYEGHPNTGPFFHIDPIWWKTAD